MKEQDVLNAILGGHSAYSLLIDADKNAERRWKRLCKSMTQYLDDVKKHFPDAQYYTASGGFNLMLGRPHDDSGAIPQYELVALEGIGVSIGDGDF